MTPPDASLSRAYCPYCLPICRQASSLFGLAVLLAGLLASSPQLLAQASMRPAVSREFTITGDAPAGVEVSPTAVQTVTVSIRNLSNRSLKVTQVGLGRPDALQAITPLTLAAGERSPLSLSVDARAVQIPGTIPVFLQVSDATGERIVLVPMPVTSHEVVTFYPRVLAWTATDAIQPKSTQLLNLPVGKTIRALAVSDPSITAQFTGTTVTVTPSDLSKPRNATVAVITEPESDQALVLIVQIRGKLKLENVSASESSLTTTTTNNR